MITGVVDETLAPAHARIPAEMLPARFEGVEEHRVVDVGDLLVAITFHVRSGRGEPQAHARLVVQARGDHHVVGRALEALLAAGADAVAGAVLRRVRRSLYGDLVAELREHLALRAGTGFEPRGRRDQAIELGALDTVEHRRLVVEVADRDRRQQHAAAHAVVVVVGKVDVGLLELQFALVVLDEAVLQLDLGDEADVLAELRLAEQDEAVEFDHVTTGARSTLAIVTVGTLEVVVVQFAIGAEADALERLLDPAADCLADLRTGGRLVGLLDRGEVQGTDGEEEGREQDGMTHLAAFAGGWLSVGARKLVRTISNCNQISADDFHLHYKPLDYKRL